MSESNTGRISVRSIFLNGHGLRVGWSTALFVALYVVLRIATQPVLGPFIALSETEPNPPQPALIREAWTVFLVFLATWVMARIEKRSAFSYGFTDVGKLTKFLSGAACGFVSLSALIGVMWASGSLVFDGFAITGATAWRYAVAWGVMFTLVGIAEESQLRGYLQYTLSNGIGFWWTALLLSIAFALLHAGLGSESALGLLADGALGMVFCLSLWYTKSLYWAVGFHSGWDWSESYFYGAPDSGMLIQGHLLVTHPVGNPLWSGGATGPEGSLFQVPLPLLLAIAMWLWWGKKRSDGVLK